MRIKKFTGATLKDATSVMKEELGGEAIILNTRRIHKGGVLNFLGKEEYEVTAAIDEEALSANAGKIFASELALAGGERSHIPAHNDTVVALQNIADKFGNRPKEKTAAGATASLGEIAGYQELRSEVENIKSIMQEVALHLKYSKMPTLPELLKEAYATLIEQDVDERLAAELVQRVYRTLGEDLLDDKQKVEERLLKEIASFFAPIPQEQPTKKEGQGSGIGLYMCRYIIELHGGEITVRSKSGEGTTFVITLPVFEEESTIVSEAGEARRHQ
jgi:flagellar biosynthesis GTPase FlhF